MPAMHHNHPESEERTDFQPVPEPTARPLWSGLTPEHRSAIEEIAAWQDSVGLNDTQFVEGCAKMSAQSWYQLRTGRYGAKDCSRMVGIAISHAKIRRKTLAKAREFSSQPFPFMETRQFREVMDAVASAQAAAESGDDDKVVWVVGKSGMGKTEAARQLVKLRTARLISASESWREGYLDALTDIALAIGVPTPKSVEEKPKAWPSKGAAERAIMTQLKARPGILCVNEVEFFSRRVLNLLRKIADESQTVVVIFCVPEFYGDILRQGGAYAEQLRTRTESVVWLEALERSDIERALCEYWPKQPQTTLKQVSTALRDYVNTFGGWRTLKRIVRHLREQFPTQEESPDLASVASAIALQKDYQHAA